MACSSSSSFSFVLPRNFHLRPQLSQFPPPLSSFLRSRSRLSIQASAALTLDLSVRISPSKLGEIKRKSNIAVVRLGPGIGGDAYITTPTPSLVGVFPSNVDFHIVVTNTETTPNNSAVQNDILACPICFETLMRRGPPGLNLEAIYRSGFKCQTCNKSYSSKNVYLDLTVTAGSEEYSENKPTSTELFRSPVVSFLYERGWRQNFNRSGFPGPDEEFKMAQEYFKPAEGGLLVDVSCGSGLFSRKFAKCGTYSGVIALDFSENMLRQCYDFTKKEGSTLSNNLALVRADVARLPFPSASIDAVHAGAALHCWPSPSNAIADITRVLRSGGVFVGTTFLRYTSSTPPLLRPLRERILQTYSYLIEEEIEDLCKSCGLVDYSSKVQQSFIMFSARKP